MLIFLGVIIAFVDERVRASLPSAPVTVTAGKDALFYLAGFSVMLRLPSLAGRYARYFLPWVVFSFTSAMAVLILYGSYTAFVSSVRTYCLLPLIFAVGYYLGMQDRVLRRVQQIFLLGGALALALALWQDTARATLPDLLSRRLYKAHHSLSGGQYNESLFASPQIAAAVFLVVFIWVFPRFWAPHRVRTFITSVLVMAGSLVGIYLTRIRIALVLALFAILVHWLLNWRRSELGSRVFFVVRVFLFSCLVIMGTALLSVFPDMTSAYATMSDVNIDQESVFYAQLTEPRVILERLTLGFQSLDDFHARGHNLLVGFGAGTGGANRRFLSSTYEIPAVHDAGLTLIFHEFGLLGLFAFSIFMVLLPATILWRWLALTQVTAFARNSLVVFLVFMFWFFVKSHSIISNGLTQQVMIAALGLTCAQLDRISLERVERRRSVRPASYARFSRGV